MDKNKKTEKKIRKAARKQFLQQGFAGARMQGIADAAGVNKALLHYYFRSKEMLFREVVRSAADKVAEAFQILSDPGLIFTDKVREFAAAISLLSRRDPDCLPFLLQVARRQPEMLDRPLKVIVDCEPFLAQIDSGMQHGFVRGSNPREVLLHLLSLALFLPLGSVVAKAVLPSDDASTQLSDYQENMGDLMLRSISN